MKNYISTLVICMMFGSLSASAQSLRIVYDLTKDEVEFYRKKPSDTEGKLISQAIVGRNKMVKLEVINFNKFVYAANATFVSSEVETSDGVDFFNTITPLVLPGTSQAFFSSLGGDLPDDTRGGVMATRGANSAFHDLQEAYTTLAKLENDVSNLDYAIKRLNELKYNPFLPGDTIKKMSERLVDMIMSTPGAQPGDFANLVVLYNDRYNKGTQQLSTASNQFLSAYNSYAKNRGDQEFEGKGLDQYARGAQEKLNAYTNETTVQDLTDKINTLENIYTSIQMNTFVFNSSQMAKDDEIEIKLFIYENPKEGDVPANADLGKLDVLTKVKEKTFTVTVQGDMKINSSIGMGFPYFESNNSFINKDSVITTQPGNNYSPNLAGYINFYPYSGRVANLGGTFGVGVPLTDRNRNLNIFLGLSGLFGTDNRIALHGGLTLGQVKSLDQGYQVGDKLLSPIQEVPVVNTWQWGAFAGISFSLANLQQQSSGD